MSPDGSVLFQLDSAECLLRPLSLVPALVQLHPEAFQFLSMGDSVLLDLVQVPFVLPLDLDQLLGLSLSTLLESLYQLDILFYLLPLLLPGLLTLPLLPTLFFSLSLQVSLHFLFLGSCLLQTLRHFFYEPSTLLQHSLVFLYFLLHGRLLLRSQFQLSLHSFQVVLLLLHGLQNLQLLLRLSVVLAPHRHIPVYQQLFEHSALNSAFSLLPEASHPSLELSAERHVLRQTRQCTVHANVLLLLLELDYHLTGVSLLLLVQVILVQGHERLHQTSTSHSLLATEHQLLFYPDLFPES